MKTKYARPVLKRFKRTVGVIAFFFAICASSIAHAEDQPWRFFGTVEAGPAFSGKNDVQIPNTNAGTRFSLKSLQGSSPIFASRLLAGFDYKRHGLRLLVAPLSVKRTGTSIEQIQFDGSRFRENIPIGTIYEFNSYRATYRYLLVDNSKWQWRLGITGKIRDAKIALIQGNTRAASTNVGFVPLIHTNLRRNFGKSFALELDVDALAVPGSPGRAIDLRISALYRVTPNIDASIGYRVLEGGADTSVYNFALLHYVTAAVRFSLFR